MKINRYFLTLGMGALLAVLGMGSALAYNTVQVHQNTACCDNIGTL